MNQTGNYPTKVDQNAVYLKGSAGSSTLLLKIWQVAWANRLLVAAIIAAALVIATIITLLTTPLFTADARVQINRIETNVSNLEGVEADSTQMRYDEFYSTQYALLETQSLAERVSRSLNLPGDQAFLEAFEIQDEDVIVSGTPAAANERVAQMLLSRIEISPVRGSSLVDIRFVSPDPRLSQRILEAWTNQFIQTSIEQRYAATGDAREFLEGRLLELREELEDSERALVTYASNTGIFAVSGGVGSSEGDGGANNETLIGTDLATMNSSLVAARAQRIQAESVLGAGAQTNSPVIQSLLSRRAELEAERASLLSRFQDNYPPVEALTAQIGELTREINEARGESTSDLRRTYQAALALERGLQQQVESLQGEYLQEQNETIQYNILRREVSTNRELYNGLLQRYREIGVASIEASNVIVVDPARIPTGRSSPNLFLNLLLGLFAGSIGAGLTVLAKEQIDHSLRDPSEVKNTLGLPLLGAVPRVANGFLVEDLRDPRSQFAEAYLAIGTMLDMSTAEGIPSPVMVTSSAAHEGKTISSYAVARMLARKGQSAVLVDMDLRSPSVASRLDIEAGKGVSAFLTGQAPLSELVIRDFEPNLSVLPAGAVPPNPGELINAGAIDRLYAELHKEFDHIIVDSPPVLGLADAPMLASRTAGTIFVIEANRLGMRQLENALNRLHNANANILGALVTKTDNRNLEYGYGYGYGYDYGNDDATDKAERADRD